MGEGCEGFLGNIWSGPLSAGETETSEFWLWFLETAGGAEAKEKVKRRRSGLRWGEAVRTAEAPRCCQAHSCHSFFPWWPPSDFCLACRGEHRPLTMRSCSLLSTPRVWKAGSRKAEEQNWVCFHQLRSVFLSGFPNFSSHRRFHSFPKDTHALPSISTLSTTIEPGNLDYIPDLSFCVFVLC